MAVGDDDPAHKSACDFSDVKMEILHAGTLAISNNSPAKRPICWRVAASHGCELSVWLPGGLPVPVPVPVLLPLPHVRHGRGGELSERERERERERVTIETQTIVFR